MSPILVRNLGQCRDFLIVCLGNLITLKPPQSAWRFFVFAILPPSALKGYRSLWQSRHLDPTESASSLMLLLSCTRTSAAGRFGSSPSDGRIHAVCYRAYCGRSTRQSDCYNGSYSFVPEDALRRGHQTFKQTDRLSNSAFLSNPLHAKAKLALLHLQHRQGDSLYTNDISQKSGFSRRNSR
jgi:hypothetical protein